MPGIKTKDQKTPNELKTLILEMIDNQYNCSEWTHVFTDGSSEEAIRNGGAGVHIIFRNGGEISQAAPTGRVSTNFRAEATAILQAADILSEQPNLSDKIVFFCDCRAVLQALEHNGKNEAHIDRIREKLTSLSTKTVVSLQWIPSHCGVQGNEQADLLSKSGSSMAQPEHQISYHEAKTIIKSRLGLPTLRYTTQDPIHNLPRFQQTVIFRLRTGHSRLLGHLSRIGVSHTDECPCGTGVQSPEHVLQHCPNHNDLRCQIWPNGEALKAKLWGPRHALELTADFISRSGLRV